MFSKMDAGTVAGKIGALTSRATATRSGEVLANNVFVQIAIVFLAYFIAGKLGQATTYVRSGNLGPVWPASGVALACVLAFGSRVWPGLAASSFIVAFQSPVLAVTAAGQAAAATIAALTGAFLLRRVANFDPSLSRLRDALGLVVFGGLAGATVSASIGMASLYLTGFQPYSGLGSAWVIYWLGDATGVLLVTPLCFTLRRLLDIRSRRRLIELGALLTLLTAASFLIFGDLTVIPVRLHVLAFAVLPVVMWAAIRFGVGGASLSVLLVAVIATLLTALGSGPFAAHTPFVNAALLDVLFMVLAVTGLALAAVIAERERSEAERGQLIRAQAATESRLHLAAIVESSNDAVLSMTLDGIILSWNAAAQRIFGFTEAEAVGQPTTLLMPSRHEGDERDLLQRLRSGVQLEAYETIGVTKKGRTLTIAVSISPLRDGHGSVVGASIILRDMTAQKQAEVALSTVSRRLIEAQEQERSRIARELHDDIGQRLAMLTLNLTALTEPQADSSRVRRQAAELQQHASQLAADIQALSHHLHSSRLTLLGLTAAMKHFCREFEEQNKATVDFQSQDVPEKVPADISLSLFRVLQEALHNAAKHSGVKAFEVRVWGTATQIHLLVKDDGKGLDRETARTGPGIGLVSMEERIKLVNGELEIASDAQHGTTIYARVPCSSAESFEASRGPAAYPV